MSQSSKCDACGSYRVASDLATLYGGDDIMRVCHGFLDPSPTCYEKLNMSEVSRDV